jgi:predicted Fe-Mo cluster-binding NifX family protein
MRIAFTTSGQSLTDPLDARFGRAAGFLIYDDVAKTIEYVNNEQNLNAAQGAGIQAAVTVANQKVDLLITGNCGPKAFQILESAGIQIYLSQAPTVAAAYEQFRAQELKQATSANVEGHWN